MSAVQMLHKVLEVFNVKGGPLMGAWTMTMIFLTLAEAKIDVVARDCYLGALAVYGVSKGHALRVDAQSKTIKPVEPGDH